MSISVPIQLTVPSLAFPVCHELRQQSVFLWCSGKDFERPTTCPCVKWRWRKCAHLCESVADLSGCCLPRSAVTAALSAPSSCPWSHSDGTQLEAGRCNEPRLAAGETIRWSEHCHIVNLSEKIIFFLLLHVHGNGRKMMGGVNLVSFECLG